MQMQLKAGAADRVTRLAQDVASLSGPCIGCTKCAGLCQALIEVMTLPDTILTRGARNE